MVRRVGVVLLLSVAVTLVSASVVRSDRVEEECYGSSPMDTRTGPAPSWKLEGRGFPHPYLFRVEDASAQVDGRLHPVWTLVFVNWLAYTAVLMAGAALITRRRRRGDHPETSDGRGEAWVGYLIFFGGLAVVLGVEIRLRFWAAEQAAGIWWEGPTPTWLYTHQGQLQERIWLSVYAALLVLVLVQSLWRRSVRGRSFRWPGVGLRLVAGIALWIVGVEAYDSATSLLPVLHGAPTCPDGPLRR